MYELPKLRTDVTPGILFTGDYEEKERTRTRDYRTIRQVEGSCCTALRRMVRKIKVYGCLHK